MPESRSAADSPSHSNERTASIASDTRKPERLPQHVCDSCKPMHTARVVRPVPTPLARTGVKARVDAYRQTTLSSANASAWRRTVEIKKRSDVYSGTPATSRAAEGHTRGGGGASLSSRLQDGGSICPSFNCPAETAGVAEDSDVHPYPTWVLGRGAHGRIAGDLSWIKSGSGESDWRQDLSHLRRPCRDFILRTLVRLCAPSILCRPRGLRFLPCSGCWPDPRAWGRACWGAGL
jgi:hypothetical protein